MSITNRVCKGKQYTRTEREISVVIPERSANGSVIKITNAVIIYVN